MHIKLACVTVVAALLPASLAADTVTPCPNATLDAYISGACQIASGVTFSNFSFVTAVPGIPIIDPTLVQVTPFQSGSDFGLHINLNGLMSQTQYGPPALDFTVHGPSNITAASVTSDQGVNDNEITASFCNMEGSLCASVIGMEGTGTSSVNMPFSDSTVQVHSLVEPGRDQAFTISFTGASPSSSVPEPVPFALAGTGLIGLGLLARKRKKA